MTTTCNPASDQGACKGADETTAATEPVRRSGSTSEEPLAWQPIETAPKDKWILVYVHWVGLVRQARFNTIKQGKKGWKVCYGADQPMCVEGVPSHWMPLPEPPK